MKRKIMIGKWVAAVALVASGVESADAALVAQYDANVATPAPDPTSAAGGSWTATGASNANTPRAAGSEMGTNYWGIADSNPLGNSSLLYTQTLDPGDLSDAGGWWARTVLRVPAGSETSSGVVLELRDGDGTASSGNYFNVSFVNNGPGQEYIGYSGATGVVKLADAELSDAYVMVDAVYSPTGDNLAVYLNGTQVGSAVPRSAFSVTGIGRVGFGTNTSGATGEHHWALVEFHSGAVPEPASVGLLGLAGLATLARRRRA